MARRRGLGALLLAQLGFLVCNGASAATAYVVRFDTTGSPVLVQPPCTYQSYRDSLIFYNESSAVEQVSLLDVSNGTPGQARPLTIEPHSTRSSDGDNTAATTWAPEPQPALWVAKLDVPDSVQIASRLLIPTGEGPECGGFPSGNSHVYASVRLPVVRALVEPSVPQVHLATDIGGNSTGSTDGRTNIGIFNGGSSTALATVELRRTCDGGLLESRTGFIPPNTVIQLNGFSEVFDGCTAIRSAAYESYVVVTVDQPSFSYTITLSNERPPWTAVSSSP